MTRSSQWASSVFRLADIARLWRWGGRKLGEKGRANTPKRSSDNGDGLLWCVIGAGIKRVTQERDDKSRYRMAYILLRQRVTSRETVLGGGDMERSGWLRPGGSL